MIHNQAFNVNCQHTMFTPRNSHQHCTTMLTRAHNAPTNFTQSTQVYFYTTIEWYIKQLFDSKLLLTSTRKINNHTLSVTQLLCIEVQWSEIPVSTLHTDKTHTKIYHTIHTGNLHLNVINLQNIHWAQILNIHLHANKSKLFTTSSRGNKHFDKLSVNTVQNNTVTQCAHNVLHKIWYHTQITNIGNHAQCGNIHVNFHTRTQATRGHPLVTEETACHMLINGDINTVAQQCHTDDFCRWLALYLKKSSWPAIWLHLCKVLMFTGISRQQAYAGTVMINVGDHGWRDESCWVMKLVSWRMRLGRVDSLMRHAAGPSGLSDERRCWWSGFHGCSSHPSRASNIVVGELGFNLVLPIPTNDITRVNCNVKSFIETIDVDAMVTMNDLNCTNKYTI